MNLTSLTIVENVVKFLTNVTSKLGIDLLFVIALGVEVLFILFYLFKSASSYEVSLNRALDKINYWLFEKKNVTENNIRELNVLFKTKAPKRLTYYWHQYVLFREGTPSSYFSAENLIEKPTKTSSYKSNIKKLGIFTGFWAAFAALFILIFEGRNGAGADMLKGAIVVEALLLAVAIALVGLLFVLFMSARRNSVLNSLYQNVSLFDRFMDNACQELPTYIDYQILFTPAEIEKGQPVLREFLDFKARKEKEEFDQAKEEQIDYVTYDFSSTGVDGSIVLERAMRESEKFLKKKEKLLVQISQLEAELDSRKKNFDNIQRESQTKIQASKENIQRLRQMQEETTNRIESNYYRKQQTQEAAKQEQLEQEFEQQRAKYLLEKGECEEEIAKLNAELEQYRLGVENAMLNEYKTFFDKFCHSAEKVVEKVFDEKFNDMKGQIAEDKRTITELEIKLKNIPAPPEDLGQQVLGQYDANGNYVYPDGTFYDRNGLFHDLEGRILTPDGQLVAEPEPPKEEKPKTFVDLGELDSFEFMTDVSQKNDVYDVATDVVNNVNKDEDIQVINSAKQAEEEKEEKEEEPVEEAPVEAKFEDFSLDGQKTEQETAEETPAEEPKEEVEEQPTEQPEELEEEAEEAVEEEEPEEEYVEEEIVHDGRPRKIVKEEEKPARKPGRPRKEAPAQPKKKVGRPKKVEPKAPARKPGRPKKAAPERKPGRPKKVVEAPKRRVGRPKKVETKKVETRKVGRPKKVVEAPKAPTKKPGRPRKVQPAEPKAPARKPGRPKKVVEAPKRSVGRPKKETLNEINKRLNAEEEKLAQMRKILNREFEDAMDGVNTKNESRNDARRNQVMKEIDDLQREAKRVMKSNGSQEKMAEINEKLEKLLEEIGRLN